MPPAAGRNKSAAAGASKAGGHSNPIATQTDDVKYKTKYKELRAKIAEVEVDNTQMHIKILKSKKAIQRLRIERSILYDRLQSSATASNPFALQTVPHLSSLNPPTAIPPPSITDPPNYPLMNPDSHASFLEGLDAAKLLALTGGGIFGVRPNLGIASAVVGNGVAKSEEASGNASGGVAASIEGSNGSSSIPLPVDEGDVMQVDV